jgi:hypothetical protein
VVTVVGQGEDGDREALEGGLVGSVVAADVYVKWSGIGVLESSESRSCSVGIVAKGLRG